MSLNIESFFSGWVSGNSVTFGQKKDEEAKQGKNFYISALYHSAQVGGIAQISVELAKYSSSTTVQVITSVAANALVILALPFALYAASVAHGQEKDVAKRVNSYLDSSRFKTVPIRLPVQLSPRAKKSITYISKNLSKITRVTFVAGTALLLSLGNVSFAAGALTISAYSFADQKGYIPVKVSLFMEKYINAISFVGYLISGTIVVKIVYTGYLLSHSKKVKAMAYRVVDLASRKYFKKYTGKDLVKKKNDPAIQEIEKPVKKEPKLSFKKMMAIVKADENDFSINPAHCAEILPELKNLPKDYKFNQLKKMFNSIDWESKYTLLRGTLKGDDRFLDYVKDHIDEDDLEIETIQEHIDQYVQELADKKNITKEEFLAKWIKNQMNCLVDILLRKREVKGMKSDLEEGIESTAKVLAYIKTMKSGIDQEDMLLRLAVEGGDYCARGIKRVSSDLVHQIVKDSWGNLDLQKDYEIKMNMALFYVRKHILEVAYNEIIKILKVPDVIASDTHAYDLYRIQLAYGFYPLSDFEMDEFTFDRLIGWELFSEVRKGMYKAYYLSIRESVKKVGAVHLGTYMYQNIQSRKDLSQQEKDDILYEYMNNAKGFENLFFVMQGVLTYDA